ncbi:PLP-dependent cysteine synthase family protein [Baekduia soli]|uniref:L-cysteine desulfhydrase Cds1 n=1 Tax=Baekduia soli TaxID=496014 RepID=A0A5B8UB95_9ACTN|nr:PLP-dependent cysteine synthase family protein [Baekduia soli]QEC50436.1 PLP-dependent cysteine synthase family protein [Baekduia soli]
MSEVVPRPVRARRWAAQAIALIEADFERSADTHLLRYPLPVDWGVDLYLKDESTHPTGSLKHRLARSLFLYGLCNGWICEGRPIIEASSGSTAVSEAYFARLLGLPFVAVLPSGTSAEKVAEIERYGGSCHFVRQASEMCRESQRLARELDGHYMDQFTYAERATDWRGNNTIAESIFEQMRREPHPVPMWAVVGAGTGGTSATIGRYVRYQRLSTRVCVVDPEHSVFAEFHRSRDRDLTCPRASRIEGIGRPRVEPSFLPDVVDRMIEVPDAASIAAARVAAGSLSRSPGASTGTNLYGVLQLIAEMLEQGQRGSIVSLVCDPGERYTHTYYDDAWLAQQGLDIGPYVDQIERFLQSGRWASLAVGSPMA